MPKVADIDHSRLGSFLLSEESLLQVLVEIQQNPQLCILDSCYITHLFNFRSLSPPPRSTFNQSYPVFAPNEYSLFFANCSPETTVTMDVRTKVYNLDPDGSRDYLSSGLTRLPSLFSVFSIAYLAFLGFWIYICYTNKLSTHRIHILMAGLLLMKALNLISAAEDKHYVKVTDTAHDWDVLFYISYLQILISPIPNEWQLGKKTMNNLEFVAESLSVDGSDSKISYGFNLWQRPESKEVVLHKLKQELKVLPEIRGMEESDENPAEGFSTALLARYGGNQDKESARTQRKMSVKN